MSNKNRSKGHNLERWLKRWYEVLGFPTKTSREASRLLDNCKVDLWNTPINWQCKSVEGNINPTVIFNQMQEELEKNYAHVANLPKAILWYKTNKMTISKNCCGHDMLVVMPFSDFEKIHNKWIETSENLPLNR